MLIHRFKSDVSGIELPSQFTFPFYYTPHPLAKIAAEELIEELDRNLDKYEYTFGLKENDGEVGKMFGILVVKDKLGNLGYLRAFSGKIGEKNMYEGYVPPIYDILDPEGIFQQNTTELNKINVETSKLEQDPNYLLLLQKRRLEQELYEKIKSRQKAVIKDGKKIRAKYRSLAKETFDDQEYAELEKSLIKESHRGQYHYKQIVQYLNERLERLNEEIGVYEKDLNELKARRKELSVRTQDILFSQYQLLNAEGEIKSVKHIFNELNLDAPAGTGECAAPKLMQYAYQHQLSPICMAEFWYGKSLPAQIRHHGHFYPSCKSKCEPILDHMLKGLSVAPNPLLQTSSENKEIKVVYEDEYLVLINKPEELLSVPGKAIQDSVQTRMKRHYPQATGPLIVHRLDMSTSGLLLVSKSEEVYKRLQQQFIKRTIKKRYVALLDGYIQLPKEGYIDLPIRVDLDNRPYQMVCYEHGKSARTKYEVIDEQNGVTRIAFYPITGRTHQLRVHAAHGKGLATPIIGDDLYGQKGKRLHLHAETITFTHPVLKEKMTFTAEAPF